MAEKKSFDFERNSFDMLRYFAAISVMFLHYTYYAITMSDQSVNTLRIIRRITEIFPGVIILFSLSGFLISASFERCKNKKEYFIKRVFRLYPELWVCTLVNLAVLFSLAKEYMDGSIFIWLLTQILGIANTPSCLDGFATGSINGALWTIFTEVQLYVVLGVIYPWLQKLKTRQWMICLSLAVAMNLLCDTMAKYMEAVVSKVIERTFFPYLLWFLIGIFCYQRREKIILFLNKHLLCLWIIYIGNQMFRLCKVGYYEDIVTGIVLPFLTISMAYSLPKCRIKRDLSYGIFLYHWIVINIMVDLRCFELYSWVICLILFVVVTILVAWLSWYMIGRNVAKIEKKLVRCILNKSLK